MRTWVNGRLLDDPYEPVLSAFDHGLTVGDGVFETISATGGQPFALTRHLRRLVRSATGLGLAEPDLELVREGIAAVTRDVGEGRARIRVTVTAGPGPLGSERGGGGQTVIVAAGPSKPWPASTAVAVVPWRRNERAPTAGLKTTSYADNVMALAYAAERDASEAIFANTAGDVCEGTGSNLAYVIDGVLTTPTLSAGCLAGVTRALVVQWCDVVEADAPLDVLAGASEMFLMSTTRDVQPVDTCDGRPLAAPGPVTRAVQDDWWRHVAEQIDP